MCSNRPRRKEHSVLKTRGGKPFRDVKIKTLKDGKFFFVLFCFLSFNIHNSRLKHLSTELKSAVN